MGSVDSTNMVCTRAIADRGSLTATKTRCKVAGQNNNDELVESREAAKKKRGTGGERWGSGDLALTRLFPLLPVPLVLLPSANGGKAGS